MEKPTFSDHDIDVLLAALHNHALKRRVKPEEAYELQKKLLALVGKDLPLTLEEAKEIAAAVYRGR